MRARADRGNDLPGSVPRGNAPVSLCRLNSNHDTHVTHAVPVARCCASARSRPQTATLNQDELKDLMKKYKPGLTVDDGDVEYVLHEADVSHTGTLSKDEVLPAIAVWRTLAEQKAKSSLCVIA